MAEQNKRVVVDAVDFTSVFGFPRILKAAASALQPARLIIGLLMVTALITAGRLWDLATEPSVSRRGLEHGQWSQSEAAEHRAELQNALQRFGTGTSGAAATLDDTHTNQALDRIRAGYEARREALTDRQEREQLDLEYIEALSDIQESSPRHVFHATASHVGNSLSQIVASVFGLDFAGVMVGLENLLITTPRVLWRDHPWFLIVYGLIALVIAAIGGGAISRIAACQIAGERRPSLREAIDFALQHWLKFVIALLLPLLLLLIMRLFIALIGLLTVAPVLDVIGGLLYGLALALGFMLAFLMIGYIAGFPLLVPAVAAENCDGSDAMQRAYAYAVSRPLHLVWYWLVAVAGLALGYLLVSTFAVIMLNSTARLFESVSNNPALNVAGGYEPLDLDRALIVPVMNWHERSTASLINLWETVIVCLVASYVLSYFFSAATAMYLLMRKAADGQDVREVWQPGLMPGTLTPMPPAVASPRSGSAAADSDHDTIPHKA